MAGFFGIFELVRSRDPTGVSGTGNVAFGAEFPDGTVTVRWRGPWATTTVHSGLESVEHIHLHAGSTELFWKVRTCAHCGLAVMAEGIELELIEQHGERCHVADQKEP